MGVDLGRDGRQATVELVYRPTRGDILVGVRLRERRRRLHLVRWGFTGLFGAGAVRVVTAPESSALSFVTAVFCAALIWSIPHLQAHHALRTVFWQGEYRTSVSETGIASETAHATLVQRWSVFPTLLIGMSEPFVGLAHPGGPGVAFSLLPLVAAADSPPGPHDDSAAH